MYPIYSMDIALPVMKSRWRMPQGKCLSTVAYETSRAYKKKTQEKILLYFFLFFKLEIVYQHTRTYTFYIYHI